MKDINLKFTKKDGFIELSVNGTVVGAFCNTTEMFIHPMDESIGIKNGKKVIASFETTEENVRYDFDGFDDLF